MDASREHSSREHTMSFGLFRSMSLSTAASRRAWTWTTHIAPIIGLPECMS